MFNINISSIEDVVNKTIDFIKKLINKLHIIIENHNNYNIKNIIIILNNIFKKFYKLYVNFTLMNNTNINILIKKIYRIIEAIVNIILILYRTKKKYYLKDNIKKYILDNYDINKPFSKLQKERLYNNVNKLELNNDLTKYKFINPYINQNFNNNLYDIISKIKNNNIISL